MAMGTFLHNLNAQEVAVKSKVEVLQKQKEEIITAEKDLLKKEVEKINEQLKKGEITGEQAQELKNKAAKKRALNIENRIDIIENKIALIERNGYENLEIKPTKIEIGIGAENKENGDILFGVNVNTGKEKKIKYDIRNEVNLVLATGLNNAIVENQNFNDSEYGYASSRFFELGLALTTRVFKKTNWLRVRYGLSYQLNGLKLKDDQYFVQDGNQTIVATFNNELKKSKFRLDHLVIPFHFEIGSSTVEKSEESIRFKTNKHFKFGFGGYAGLRVATRQKLKYEIDGETIKDKFKKSYNTNDLTYGLSAYIGKGDFSFYAKYDLSPIFKDAVIEQNNVSLGVRFDF